jgi:hypothetical protein
MAKMMIMGQSTAKAVQYVLITGATATVAKFAGDALGDRLFVQAAGETPRTADERKMTQLYRGLVTIAGGLVVGKLLWSRSKSVAFGLAAGFTVSGMDRILTTYDVTRQISNVFRASDAQLPAPAAGSVPSYNGSAGAMMMLPVSTTYTGPMVARERVAMTSR